MNTRDVSLVIPGRNCARTIRPCLSAVVPLLEQRDSRLSEIVFVDDGSTDDTAKIVDEFPIRCVHGGGKGRGAARNLGWRTATGSLIWFVDSDCVCEPDALERLLSHMDDPGVAAVGGSYGNMEEGSLLACLIHEEIVERHRRMPSRVNFLATFNVIYRKKVLEEVEGFNERFVRGQDAELAWRVVEAGHELAFEINARVKHYHPVSWGAYLSVQKEQGYWRVFLHTSHAGHAVRGSYSGWVDHAQPPLAMLLLASLPLALLPPAVLPSLRFTPIGLMALLVACQLPMTWRLVRRTGRARYLVFAWMSLVRSFWRGFGLTLGIVSRFLFRRQA